MSNNQRQIQFQQQSKEYSLKQDGEELLTDPNQSFLNSSSIIKGNKSPLISFNGRQSTPASKERRKNLNSTAMTADGSVSSTYSGTNGSSKFMKAQAIISQTEESISKREKQILPKSLNEKKINQQSPTEYDIEYIDSSSRPNNFRVKTADNTCRNFKRSQDIKLKNHSTSHFNSNYLTGISPHLKDSQENKFMQPFFIGNIKINREVGLSSNYDKFEKKKRQKKDKKVLNSVSNQIWQSNQSRFQPYLNKIEVSKTQGSSRQKDGANNKFISIKPNESHEKDQSFTFQQSLDLEQNKGNSQKVRRKQLDELNIYDVNSFNINEVQQTPLHKIIGEYQQSLPQDQISQNDTLPMKSMSHQQFDENDCIQDKQDTSNKQIPQANLHKIGKNMHRHIQTSPSPNSKSYSLININSESHSPLFNQSSSTWRFSTESHVFSKASRFITPKLNGIYKLHIDVPTTKGKRSASFGFGNKTDIFPQKHLERAQLNPSPQSHNIKRIFDEDPLNPTTSGKSSDKKGRSRSGKSFGESFDVYRRTFLKHVEKMVYAPEVQSNHPGPDAYDVREKIGQNKKTFTIYGRLPMFNEQGFDLLIPGSTKYSPNEKLVKNQRFTGITFGIGNRIDLTKPANKNPGPIYDLPSPFSSKK